MISRNAAWATALINAPGLYAAVVDHSGHIAFINSELMRVCGQSVEPLIGQSAVGNILTPDNLLKVMALLNNSHPTPHPLAFEENLQNSQGEQRILAFLASRHGSRHTEDLAALLIGVDVTGRAEITEALRRSESHIRAIVETAVDAIITIDAAGAVESFNPAAEHIFGYLASEVIGRKVDMLMPEPYCHEHQRYVENYLRTGHAKIIGIGREVTGLRKDGTTFPMYLAVGEQKTPDGIHFTGIIRDITERKRMEAEILHISEREQRRIGQDLHDGLGQLLTGAAMVSKAISQRLKKKSKLLATEVEKLTTLINEGIAQSRQLARGLHPLDSPDDLPNALQELGFRTENIPGIACRIRAEPLPESCTLLTATHLYRIAQEAVNNAVRHGAASNIEVSCRTLGSAVRLTIRDNGKGFTAQRGEGLGLRIMDYRARVIGGHLEIRSSAGSDTTVICSVAGPEPGLEQIPHG
ncbi:MAG: PAS domain S-box protein [Phycisphaerae bacterium]